MYTDLSTSTVQFGQSLPTDGLIIYYDLSNFASYDGADTKITNLVRAYPNYSGSLFNNPVFTSAGGQSYLTLNKASLQYVKFFVNNFGPDYTSVAVVASTTTAWDGTGWLAGGIQDADADNNAGTTNAFFGARAAVGTNVVVGDYYYFSALTTYYADTGYSAVTSNINQPHLYYHGLDQTNRSFIAGYDGIVNQQVGLTTPPGTRGAVSSNGYIGRTDTGASAEYVSIKLYLYMLYNRKVTAAEAAALYQFTKTRFNLS